MNRIFLLIALIGLTVAPARANIILVVDVLDERTLGLTISGTIEGPAASFSKGVLWVDVPITETFQGYGEDVTGDLMLGSSPLHVVYTGFDNYAYGSTLQLRTWQHGATPLSIGDVAQGSAVVTFESNGHGLTQSMFDGAGVPIYWGQRGTPGFDTAEYGALQGYAVTTAPANVPDGGIAALIPVSFLLGLSLLRRRPSNSDEPVR